MFILDHYKALTLREWQTQQAEADSEQEQKRIADGGAATRPAVAQQPPQQQPIKEEAVRQLATEGESILQAVLEEIAQFHLVRQNELSLQCYWAARRGHRHDCAVLPTNTPMTECCITRRRHHCERVRFYYRDTDKPSPLFTVHHAVGTFLTCISWIASFPAWIKQLVRTHLHEWKTANDVLALTDKDFWLAGDDPEFQTLLRAIQYTRMFIAKHQDATSPSPPQTAPGRS